MPLIIKIVIGIFDKNYSNHSLIIKEFINECTIKQANSHEVFIRHYKKNYSAPILPPSWMLIELLSFGAWSKLYKNLNKRSDRKHISDMFSISPTELISWLHCITYIRNLCAHHARLWNRHFTFRPQIVEKYKKFMTPNHTFCAQATMLNALLHVISPDVSWVNSLRSLLFSNESINKSFMGFEKAGSKIISGTLKLIILVFQFNLSHSHQNSFIIIQ